jgi:hypothetical protein
VLFVSTVTINSFRLYEILSSTAVPCDTVTVNSFIIYEIGEYATVPCAAGVLYKYEVGE